MEIESFWKNLPPFAKPMKGHNGVFGYGLVKRTGRQKYHNHHPQRKARREIRKYGFDLSETWNLDYTFMCWLSDTFGGFFRLCGEADNWGNYDENGNYLKEIDNEISKIPHSVFMKMGEYENMRTQSYLKHLKDFLENATVEDIRKFSDFCSPRLRVLADTTISYPPNYDYDEWRKTVKGMATAFDNCLYSEKFVEDFFCLWD